MLLAPIIQPPLPKPSTYEVIAACQREDIESLKRFAAMGVDFNTIRDYDGDGLLSVAIYYDCPKSFEFLLGSGIDIEQKGKFDKSTPLLFAAMIGELGYAQKLVEVGANINAMDKWGFTPLTNSLFYDNRDLAKYFLMFENVDVNIMADVPGLGEMTPVIYAYVLWEDEIVDKIIAHPQFDPTFTHFSWVPSEIEELMRAHQCLPDEMLLSIFHEAKCLGLRYDFDGEFTLAQLGVHGEEPLHFEFEGYGNALSVSAAVGTFEGFLHDIIYPSHVPDWAKMVYQHTAQSLAFHAHISNPQDYLKQYYAGEALFIASGWDGHAVEVVIDQDRFYRCNRGELSDGIHGIEEFVITQPQNLTVAVFEHLLAAEGTPHFLQNEIKIQLGLEKIGEIENPEQTVGNCPWTSLEAGVEALLLTHFLKQGVETQTAHALAKQGFTAWERYDLAWSLDSAVEHRDLFLDNNIYDDLLFKIFENQHNAGDYAEVERGSVILNEMIKPELLSDFDDLIGQYVIKYDPWSYQNIHYMAHYENKPSSLSQTFYDWLYLDYYLADTQTQETAKSYYEFLKACDHAQGYSDSDAILTLEDIFGVVQEPLLALDLSPAALPETLMPRLTMPVMHELAGVEGLMAI